MTSSSLRCARRSFRPSAARAASLCHICKRREWLHGIMVTRGLAKRVQMAIAAGAHLSAVPERPQQRPPRLVLRCAAAPGKRAPLASAARGRILCPPSAMRTGPCSQPRPLLHDGRSRMPASWICLVLVIGFYLAAPQNRADTPRCYDSRGARRREGAARHSTCGQAGLGCARGAPAPRPGRASQTEATCRIRRSTCAPRSQPCELAVLRSVRSLGSTKEHVVPYMPRQHRAPGPRARVTSG